MLVKVNETAESVGLSINCAKTKSMTAPSDLPCQISLKNCMIEKVDSFPYLGSSITPSGDASDEINRRIGKASAAFNQLTPHLWRKHNVSLQTKIRVYKSSVQSILLYGCETWPMKVADARRLNAFEQRCLRSILKIRYTHHITNLTVLQKCKITDTIEQRIQTRRLTWLGHVLRKPVDEPTQFTLMANPCHGWKKKRGGQIKTWNATVLDDLDPFGGHLLYGRRQWEQNWRRLIQPIAANRQQWRALVRDLQKESG